MRELSRAWRDLAYRLRALLGRSRRESELDQELRFHLEMEIERRMAAGEDRASAERAARLDFGAPEAVKEAVRDAWGTRLVQETARDVRSALRHFVQAPAFSLAAVGSLALGLGAAAVIFSLIDAVLLRPLPFDRPERIVAFYELTPQGDRFSVSDRNLVDFRREIDGLAHLAAVAYPSPRPALGHDGRRLRLDGEAVSPSFFDVLGIDARLGRTFDFDDGGPAPPREVVLSDAAWRRYFGADPDILGRSVDLDGERHTVIGVLPEGFRFGRPVDLYLPHALDLERNRGDHRLEVYGRLAPGASFEQAQQQTRTVAERLAERFPDSNHAWGAELLPIEHHFLGAEDRRLTHVLLGAMVLLLVLAAVNVSSLLLARAADRGHEMRLRLALGAGRWRLMRQLMTESVLLALAGAAGGLALALVAVPSLAALEIPIPRLDAMRLDARVLAFLTGGALLQSLLFGLTPALGASRRPDGQLASRRQGDDAGSSRLRSSLIVAEVALATVLTLGAGLLLHSFSQLRGVDAGFAPGDDVLLVHFDLPLARYPEGAPQTRAFFRQLRTAVESMPGVEAAGLSTSVPFTGENLRNNVGREDETNRDAFVPIHWRASSGDLFRALGIPLLRGRRLLDDEEARPEAVISQSLAERLWPGEDAVGRTLRWIGPRGPKIEVVGVVGDLRDMELAWGQQPTIYLPQERFGWPTMVLAVKPRGAGGLEAAALAPAVRATVAEIDPLLAPPPISTLGERRGDALARPLLGLGLLSAAAAIALALAAIGVYGLLAYSLARRRREIGVRMALGARPVALASRVAGSGLRLVGLGLLIGGALAAFAAESLRAILFSTSPFEPAVVVTVAAVLIAVGLAASGLPALRAARVDPVEALRRD